MADGLAINIKYKLETLKEELTNIAYAIHWVKAQIINYFILSDSELSIAREILIIDIISLSSIKIESLNILEIRSVSKEHKINFKTLVENRNNIYGIESKCNNYNLLICTNNQNTRCYSENTE